MNYAQMGAFTNFILSQLQEVQDNCIGGGGYHPAHPIYLPGRPAHPIPPGIWGGPIIPPGTTPPNIPPGIWPSPGHPEHPIYFPPTVWPTPPEGGPTPPTPSYFMIQPTGYPGIYAVYPVQAPTSPEPPTPGTPTPMK